MDLLNECVMNYVLVLLNLIFGQNRHMTCRDVTSQNIKISEPGICHFAVQQRWSDTGDFTRGC